MNKEPCQSFQNLVRARLSRRVLINKVDPLAYDCPVVFFENSMLQMMSCEGAVYKVFYSKDIRKKKKVFSEGVLVCEEKKTKLFTADGELLISVKGKSTPEPDEEYTINNTYVVVADRQVSLEEYHSGRIFIEEKTELLSLVKKPAKKKQSLHKIDFQIGKEFANGLRIEAFIYPLLREHQVQGVNFMYECLSGLRGAKITGCILADFMGLGKTLQTLTLIRCLLINKVVSKVLVLCPLTLLKVWEKECTKWMGSKLNPLVALGSSQDIEKVVRMFSSYEYRMLVATYQHFYKYSRQIGSACDLLVFDEGHRLKNKKSKLFVKIKQSKCKKRLLLTGTPLQNNLDELYTCITLVNPCFFDSEAVFRNVFQKPIISGMAKGASKELRTLALSRTAELAQLIKQFSLRRRADVLENYLPKKRQYQIFLKLSPLQLTLYQRILKKKVKDTEVLSYLNQTRKLFTHPILFKTDRFDNNMWKDCFEDCRDEDSYKMNFIKQVAIVCKKRAEKVVIVSYFTETLDFIEQMLKEEGISSSKLDGRLEGRERYQAIEHFISSTTALLLSGKAGGTGLTLTCASKMIIVEPDWNPSNDSQVMGRVWRQGQNKEVDIYRLLIGCSFEEKILQRQQLKQSLSEKLIDEQNNTNSFDFCSLKQLFMEIAPKCLTYSPSENQLECCQKNLDHIDWSETLFVKIIESHQRNKTSLCNEFQEAQFEEGEASQGASLKDQLEEELSDLDFVELNQLQEQKVNEPQPKRNLLTMLETKAAEASREIERKIKDRQEDLDETEGEQRNANLSSHLGKNKQQSTNIDQNRQQLNEKELEKCMPLALQKMKKRIQNVK